MQSHFTSLKNPYRAKNELKCTALENIRSYLSGHSHHKHWKDEVAYSEVLLSDWAALESAHQQNITPLTQSVSAAAAAKIKGRNSEIDFHMASSAKTEIDIFLFAPIHKITSCVKRKKICPRLLKGPSNLFCAHFEPRLFTAWNKTPASKCYVEWSARRLAGWWNSQSIFASLGEKREAVSHKLVFSLSRAQTCN